jgi:hypothetical protein
MNRVSKGRNHILSFCLGAELRSGGHNGWERGSLVRQIPVEIVNANRSKTREIVTSYGVVTILGKGR